MTWLRNLTGIALILASVANAESTQPEYPGVADPFADPGQYEFADDEKEDKEFFHLGRFFMMGLDVGAGVFTGGLGASAGAGMQFGARVLYFFDRSIAFEGRIHYSNHLDVTPVNGSSYDLETNLIEAAVGFRYYFDTKSAPRAIAIANPYLGFGAGLYSRDQIVVRAATGFPEPEPSSSFGGNAGGGVEFLVYRKHIYVGLDLRYHMIFFPDENLSWNGAVGGRAGDYFTTLFTVTYNF